MLNTPPTPDETVRRPAPTALDELRERMLKHGAATLSDAELLSLLIRHTDTQAEVTALARRVLDAARNDLRELGRMNTHDLLAVAGMTTTKALMVTAALELGQRRHHVIERDRARVATSFDADALLRPHLKDLHHEEFWLLALDRGLRVLDTVRVSSGGMHGTVADPKLIFRMALERRASAIILAHNHPSGQLRPSEEDIRLTKKLVEAGKFMEITVQDHVIVCSTGYYSFADNGMM